MWNRHLEHSNRKPRKLGAPHLNGSWALSFLHLFSLLPWASGAIKRSPSCDNSGILFDRAPRNFLLLTEAKQVSRICSLTLTLWIVHVALGCDWELENAEKLQYDPGLGAPLCTYWNDSGYSYMYSRNREKALPCQKLTRPHCPQQLLKVNEKKHMHTHMNTTIFSAQ